MAACSPELYLVCVVRRELLQLGSRSPASFGESEVLMCFAWWASIGVSLGPHLVCGPCKKY